MTIVLGFKLTKENDGIADDGAVVFTIFDKLRRRPADDVYLSNYLEVS